MHTCAHFPGSVLLNVIMNHEILHSKCQPHSMSQFLFFLWCICEPWLQSCLYYLWMFWFFLSVTGHWYTAGIEFTSDYQLSQISLHVAYWPLKCSLLCHSKLLERAVLHHMYHFLCCGLSSYWSLGRVRSRNLISPINSFIKTLSLKPFLSAVHTWPVKVHPIGFPDTV